MDDRNRVPPRKRQGEDAAKRSKFAEGMARTEFGRFYWNGRQAAELERVMRTPKPVRSKPKRER